MSAFDSVASGVLEIDFDTATDEEFIDLVENHNESACDGLSIPDIGSAASSVVADLAGGPTSLLGLSYVDVADHQSGTASMPALSPVSVKGFDPFTPPAFVAGRSVLEHRHRNR